MTKEQSGINNNGILPQTTVLLEIQSYIKTIEQEAAIYEEKNFDRRAEVIDYLGFPVIDQLDEFLRKATQPAQLLLLKHRAEKIKTDLEAIDINLFQRLRANIQSGAFTGTGLKNLIREYVSFDHEADQEDIGYDNLDLFINGLLPLNAIPEQTKDLEPEMVFYQKTPARVIFELAEQAHFTKDDVFFDLGSGLGQVGILVNLLTGIITKGIEFEPAFCTCARDCAEELNLSKVSFINTDARKADYTDGTVFFMFTPFRGEIMQEVLAALRKEAETRKIKIATYGPCTTQVALQSWLRLVSSPCDDIYKLAFFTSL